mmetsp:Transcript_2738/g.6383  ORF Transcript_2738/g.6383 Transcript_2738/m.6383 type:complete len:131 (+) Transcript_2738:187-579(+)
MLPWGEELVLPETSWCPKALSQTGRMEFERRCSLLVCTGGDGASPPVVSASAVPHSCVKHVRWLALLPASTEAGAACCPPCLQGALLAHVVHAGSAQVVPVHVGLLLQARAAALAARAPAIWAPDELAPV